MKGTVWVVATCTTDDFKPIIVGVFASEEAAKEAADKDMRAEWESACAWASDPSDRPYPGFTEAPQELALEYANNGQPWGQIIIAAVEVDLFEVALRSA
jgi:hypothetical protein